MQHQEALSWLDDQAKPMQSLIEKLCNINSGTFNPAGVNEIRDVLAEEFKPISDSVELLDVPPHEIVDNHGDDEIQEVGGALDLKRRESVDQRVFLGIHLDTVYPPTHSFQTCEVIGDGILRGPGVADAKGGIVVMLFALRCFEQSKFANKLGWEVLLNPDEEIGSPCSAHILRKAAERCRIGFLFEPAYADGAMVEQRGGSGNFSIVVKGKSAHSGRDFYEGRNAVISACEVAQKLNSLNGQLPNVTYNVARIDGGGPFNMVPDAAVVRLNVRMSQPEQIPIVENQIKEVVRLENEVDGITAQLHGFVSSPPKPIDQATQQIQKHIESAANDLKIGIQWIRSGGASDGNKMHAAGLPNIDTLGVVGGNIHSNQEYMYLESLVERAKLVALLLMNYATGEFEMP